MRTTGRLELAHIGILIAMFGWSALLWPIAPDNMPVHFGLNGNVDRMGSKLEGLFALPVAALVLYVVLRFLPRLDPARANYPTFAGAYGTIRLSVLALLAIVDLAVLLPVAGVPVDQAVVIRFVLGGILVVFGSVMGKIRPNWLVGIRTPWTLASKVSWVKTHRVGGWIFILVGIIFVITLGLPSTAALVVSFGAFAVGIGCILVYSYFAWRKDPVRYPAIATRPADE